MEKRTAHYRLVEIQASVRELGGNAFTASALRGVEDMGLVLGQALEVIAVLDRRAFVKSMTTYVDHRIWQDVYHAPTPAGVAYVKFTLRAGAVVISFKRKDS